MKLFVGLGNPGAKYEKTRHNIGFLAIDAIARSNGFSPERSKFQGQLVEGKLGTEKVFALKPTTFMNLSGQSVGEAMRFYKMTPEDVIVFHDELDLAPGKIRVKRGGGHAGHNGLRSCHEHIGADYQRVRLGIGHPGDKRLVSGFVLHDFAKADWDWIDPLLDAIGEASPLLAAEDAAGFMNRVALKTAPPKAAPEEKTAAPAGDRRPEATATAETATKAQPPESLSPLARLAAHFRRR